jgi:hypothetical protein
MDVPPQKHPKTLYFIPNIWMFIPKKYDILCYLIGFDPSPYPKTT